MHSHCHGGCAGVLPRGLDVVDVTSKCQPGNAVHQEALPQRRPLPGFSCRNSNVPQPRDLQAFRCLASVNIHNNAPQSVKHAEALDWAETKSASGHTEAGESFTCHPTSFSKSKGTMLRNTEQVETRGTDACLSGRWVPPCGRMAAAQTP